MLVNPDTLPSTQVKITKMLRAGKPYKRYSTLVECIESVKSRKYSVRKASSVSEIPRSTVMDKVGEHPLKLPGAKSSLDKGGRKKWWSGSSTWGRSVTAKQKESSVLTLNKSLILI